MRKDLTEKEFGKIQSYFRLGLIHSKFFILSKYGTNMGTGRSGEIKLKYKEMVSKIGEPNSQLIDNWKVSHEWIFEDIYGNIYTVYDYKETNLYNDELPSFEEFTSKEQTYHIGGSRYIEHFKQWIIQKLTGKYEIHR